MKNERKLGAILSYVYIFINAIMTFIYTPFLINYLGKSEYGLYSLAISIMSYLSMLDLGLGNAMIRYTTKYKALGKEEEGKVINGFFLAFYIIIGIITLILGFILFKYSELLFGYKFTFAELNTMKIIILILTINVAISFPLSVFGSYIISNEKFVFQKILLIVKAIIYPIILIFFLVNGAKSVEVVLLLSVFNLLINLLNMFYSMVKLKMKFNISRKCLKYFKEIFNYSFFVFLIMIVDNVFNNTDQIILGAVCGTFVVGIYGVASQIRMMNEQMSTAINGVFLPKIVSLVEKETSDDELNNLFNKISKIQMIIMFLILFGFIMFGKSFVVLWSGIDYIEAYYISLVILIPAVIPLTQNICLHIIQAKNKHRFRSIIYLLVAILNIIITIPLSKLYGGVGAAIGSSIALVLGNIIIMNIYYYKVIHIDIITYWKNILKLVICIGLYSICVLGIIKVLDFKINDWFSLIIACICYTIGYVLIIYLFFVDKTEVNKIIKRFIYNFFPKFLIRNYIIFESNPDMSDNAYSIYNYMLERKLNEKFKFVWFVQDKRQFRNIKEKNVIFVDIYPNKFKSKLEKIYYNYTAKLIMDGNKYVHKIHKNQLRIHLTHGMSYKKCNEYLSCCGEADKFVVTGKYFNEYLSSGFEASMDKFIDIGYPRNDVLKGKKDIKNKLNVKNSSKLILWLPTYRTHKNINSKKNHIKEIPILSTKKDYLKLNEFLKENNMYIYLKPHPAQNLNIIKKYNLSNFKIIYDSDLYNLNINLYEFLSGTDSLLTDYSSVYTDYLLTENIIGVTLDDYLEFHKRDELTCDDFSKIIGGEHIYNYDDLIVYLEKVKNNKFNKKKYKEEIKKYHTYNDNYSTKRLYEFIVKQLNIK